MHHHVDVPDFFSLLSDELGRCILVLLMSEHELCVCESFFAPDAIQSKVSRHEQPLIVAIGSARNSV